MEKDKITPRNKEEIHLIAIEQIDILNPRDRNEKVFSEIVDSISLVGLKKPITVTQNADEKLPYQLICGEGRLKAFRILGETHIPARVIDVNKEEALIMSLVENIARKRHRAMELLGCIGRLADLDYDKHAISQKTGLAPDYIQGIITLLKNSEERLLYAVEQKRIPLNIALMIANTTNNNTDMQLALQEAYESGLLKGQQLLQAKKIMDIRHLSGKSPGYGRSQQGSRVSANDIVKTYQREVERQRTTVKKAEQNQQRLAFILGALSQLKKDEHFSTLLRAESLDNLPQYINEQTT
ncbi:chromosome partitioning protein ParB [Alkanindiges hydrocarboniclasticus]|uniref:Chromosome partitioning protein ParB n=1 Tax=Alkanindiges hydrocarboniclasticus TaxID=1907941 RepID=A0A1S8CX81_9GAMM|nr:ParB/RepB/Spo0J family partition protein [Alkanindiges hydrocarboniclasticus]ONG41797.1 chromosome partitioning protein ParB [Alkanindiges hydrocarboniclasticus]